MGATNSAVIDAPIEAVWAILYDVDAILEWQPDLKSARCLERDAEGRPVLVETVLDTVIRQTTATLRLSYEKSVMRWEKESGDVPGFVGSWTLTRVSPKKTRVEYQLDINFGRLGKLVRGPLAGAMNSAAGSSMPGKLKAYVEANVPGRAETLKS